MSIHAFDLDLLGVLHAVLEERHVGRAARRLHVTPSAVSNALARLRAALGDPLFVRRGRGIVPTPRALELAPTLTRTFAELERALAAEPFDPTRCTRRFTLAVADVGLSAWVPELSVALRRQMPLATLRVVGIDALLSLGDLASPEIDVHVGVAARGPELHVESLRAEASELVAGPAHPVSRRTLSRAALAELRHVRVEMAPGRGLRDPFERTFASAGIPRDVVLAVPSFGAAAEVVARTELVAMMPASMRASRAPALGLHTLRTRLPSHVVAYAMCWHDRTHTDAAARAFRAIVRRAVLDAGEAPRDARRRPARADQGSR